MKHLLINAPICGKLPGTLRDTVFYTEYCAIIQLSGRILGTPRLGTSLCRERPFSS